jgi:hypothetical protein
VHIRTGFDDDQCVFELPHVLRIHAEVCLQWLGDCDTNGNVEECTTRPDSPMQSGKLVISRWHALHKVFPDKVRMLLHSIVHIEEDDTKTLPLFFQVVVHHFTFVLCSYSSEHFALRLRNTQSVVDLANVLRHFIPVICFLCSRSCVIDDVI